ncbi:MAG: phosphonate C-P lyase system protein PhnG [Rhodoferax sp.]|nr:phosphonate C-P lyase system protein PhnG [Rhodoferax sp.]
MLHHDYKPADTGSNSNSLGRSDWMALLARAPESWLEIHLATQCAGDLQWLRPLETGLMMVQGRAGGSGQRFNLGEVRVTRCVLKPDPAHTGCHQVGVAYVMGGSHRHAQLAAMADALLQEPALHAHWSHVLLQPLKQMQDAQRQQKNAQAQATRVEFFTVAREAGNGSDDEGDF